MVLISNVRILLRLFTIKVFAQICQYARRSKMRTCLKHCNYKHDHYFTTTKNLNHAQIAQKIEIH